MKYHFEIWVTYRYREDAELYCECNKADMLNALDDLYNPHFACSQGIISVEAKKVYD